MTLQDAYLEAKKEGYPSLALLIEFLVMEKKVLTFADDAKELDLYFQPKHHDRMNDELMKHKLRK